MIFLSRIGSSILSTSFSIPSISKGKPSSIQVFKMKSLNLLALRVVKHCFGSNVSANLNYVHLRAYSYGSTNKQYLLDSVIIIPF